MTTTWSRAGSRISSISAGILVGEDRDEPDQLGEGEGVAERGPERTHTGRVVRGVDEHGRRPADDLQPTRRGHVGEPLPHDVEVEPLLAATEERLHRDQRGRGVAGLVLAVQRQEDVRVVAGEPAQRQLLPAERDLARGDAEVVALEHDPRPDLVGALEQDLGDIALLDRRRR